MNLFWLCNFNENQCLEIKALDISKDPLFHNGTVTIQPALEEDHKGTQIQIINVNFEPGARNKLHTHTSEQVLVITQGTKIVATKDKEYIVTPRMIAYIPAAKNTGMEQPKTQFSLICQYLATPTNLTTQMKSTSPKR